MNQTVKPIEGAAQIGGLRCQGNAHGRTGHDHRNTSRTTVSRAMSITRMFELDCSQAGGFAFHSAELVTHNARALVG